MSKILVDLYIPAADRRCDVFIPFECSIHEVTELVKGLFADDADVSFIPVEDTSLCDAATGEVLDVDRSACDLGLENGSRLLLI